MKRLFIWLFMQNKRLLNKPTFVLTLVCIPVLVIAINLFAVKDAGIYRVVLCAQDESTISKNAIERLCNADSVILFTSCDHPQTAVKMTENGKADAAWIFLADADEKIEKMAKSGTKKAIVRVVEREDTVQAKLAHERLYASIYPEITYNIYKNFLIDSSFGSKITDEYIDRKYENSQLNDNLVVFRYLEESSQQNSNYITSPIRGFMALTVILCGLSAQMVFLSDKKTGHYDRLPAKKRYYAGIGLTFVAVLDACVAAFVSLLITNGLSNISNELISILCLIPTATAFCVFLGEMFRSHKILGVFVPFILLTVLALSPIFFNLDAIRRIQMLFPPYYCINSAYSIRYAGYALVYSASLFILSAAIDRFVFERE